MKRLGLAHRPFDWVQEGTTAGLDAEADAAVVRPWAEAGATWWLDTDWSVPAERVEQYARDRLVAGPPAIPSRPARVRRRVHEARVARTTREIPGRALGDPAGGARALAGALALVVALAFSVPTIAAQCVQLGMVQYLIDGGRLVIATMAQTAGGQAGWVVAIRMAGRPKQISCHRVINAEAVQRI